MASERLRRAVQIGWTALSNGYVAGFLNGKIYGGALKSVCVPGLNCYSCPGALGACPVGSFQASLAGARVPLYVMGFLFAFGALLGRFVCGWLCPFGLVQDLLSRIPCRHRRRDMPGDKFLRYLKYVVLIVLVVALPLLVRDSVAGGDPWFCKFLCPSGTLMGGWTLLAIDAPLRSAAGFLFAWKSVVLIFIIVLSVIYFRPFCKYLCPLGAFYGFFNKIALCRHALNEKKCTSCGRCATVCPMSVKLPGQLNSAECIRCGRCVDACADEAITSAFKIASRGKERACTR